MSACASIVCVAPTSTTAGGIQITAPITFTISTTGNAFAFILDEWVTSDGAQNGSVLSPNLAYALNGTATSRDAVLYDDLANTIGSLTPNDGYSVF